jgi:hypothetical protein
MTKMMHAVVHGLLLPHSSSIKQPDLSNFAIQIKKKIFIMTAYQLPRCLCLREFPEVITEQSISRPMTVYVMFWADAGQMVGLFETNLSQQVAKLNPKREAAHGLPNIFSIWATNFCPATVPHMDNMTCPKSATQSLLNTVASSLT